MKPLKIICFVLLLGFAGCTSVQLKYNTLQQGQSLTDLEYEMVLDNIAMQKDSPGALPWHAIITKASITINDVVNPSGAYKTGMPPNSTLSLGLSRAWQGDWTFTPVVDPSVLTNLLAIYKKAAKAGWFHTGTPDPVHAAYSGHYGSTYVWVDKAPAGLSGLARTAIQVLNGATLVSVPTLSLSTNNVGAFVSFLLGTNKPPGIRDDAVSPFLFKQLPSGLQYLMTRYISSAEYTNWPPCTNSPDCTNLYLARWLAPALVGGLNKTIAGWTTNDVLQLATSMQMSSDPRHSLRFLEGAINNATQSSVLLQNVNDALASYYIGVLQAGTARLSTSSPGNQPSAPYLFPGPTYQIR